MGFLKSGKGRHEQDETQEESAFGLSSFWKGGESPSESKMKWKESPPARANHHTTGKDTGGFRLPGEISSLVSLATMPIFGAKRGVSNSATLLSTASKVDNEKFQNATWEASPAPTPKYTQRQTPLQLGQSPRRARLSVALPAPSITPTTSETHILGEGKLQNTKTNAFQNSLGEKLSPLSHGEERKGHAGGNDPVKVMLPNPFEIKRLALSSVSVPARETTELSSQPVVPHPFESERLAISASLVHGHEAAPELKQRSPMRARVRRSSIPKAHRLPTSNYREALARDCLPAIADSGERAGFDLSIIPPEAKEAGALSLRVSPSRVGVSRDAPSLKEQSLTEFIPPGLSLADLTEVYVIRDKHNQKRFKKRRLSMDELRERAGKMQLSTNLKSDSGRIIGNQGTALQTATNSTHKMDQIRVDLEKNSTPGRKARLSVAFPSPLIMASTSGASFLSKGELKDMEEVFTQNALWHTFSKPTIESNMPHEQEKPAKSAVLDPFEIKRMALDASPAPTRGKIVMQHPFEIKRLMVSKSPEPVRSRRVLRYSMRQDDLPYPKRSSEESGELVQNVSPSWGNIIEKSLVQLGEGQTDNRRLEVPPIKHFEESPKSETPPSLRHLQDNGLVQGRPTSLSSQSLKRRLSFVDMKNATLTKGGRIPKRTSQRPSCANLEDFVLAKWGQKARLHPAIGEFPTEAYSKLSPPSKFSSRVMLPDPSNFQGKSPTPSQAFARSHAKEPTPLTSQEQRQTRRPRGSIVYTDPSALENVGTSKGIAPDALPSYIPTKQTALCEANQTPARNRRTRGSLAFLPPATLHASNENTDKARGVDEHFMGKETSKKLAPASTAAPIATPFAAKFKKTFGFRAATDKQEPVTYHMSLHGRPRKKFGFRAATDQEDPVTHHTSLHDSPRKKYTIEEKNHGVSAGKRSTNNRFSTPTEALMGAVSSLGLVVAEFGVAQPIVRGVAETSGNAERQPVKTGPQPRRGSVKTKATQQHTSAETGAITIAQGFAKALSTPQEGPVKVVTAPQKGRPRARKENPINDKNDKHLAGNRNNRFSASTEMFMGAVSSLGLAVAEFGAATSGEPGAGEASGNAKHDPAKAVAGPKRRQAEAIKDSAKTGGAPQRGFVKTRTATQRGSAVRAGRDATQRGPATADRRGGGRGSIQTSNFNDSDRRQNLALRAQNIAFYQEQQIGLDGEICDKELKRLRTKVRRSSLVERLVEAARNRYMKELTSEEAVKVNMAQRKKELDEEKKQLFEAAIRKQQEEQEAKQRNEEKQRQDVNDRPLRNGLHWREQVSQVVQEGVKVVQGVVHAIIDEPALLLDDTDETVAAEPLTLAQKAEVVFDKEEQWQKLQAELRTNPKCITHSGVAQRMPALVEKHFQEAIQSY
jgi:hypothetical protein